MTAKWWAIQEKIKENEATPQDLYNDVLETVNKIISQRYSFAIGKGRFDNPLPYADSIVGICPRCSGEVVERNKNFGCVNWPQPHNCKFTIWKEPIQLKNMAVTIGTEEAKQLLAGKTAEVVSADGRKLYIKLDDSKKSEYGPQFVFETAPVAETAEKAKTAPKKKVVKENKEEIPEDNGQLTL